MTIQRFLPLILIVLSIILFFINIIGLMRLVSPFITMPLLFLSIFFSFYTLTYRKVYRGTRQY